MREYGPKWVMRQHLSMHLLASASPVNARVPTPMPGALHDCREFGNEYKGRMLGLSSQCRRHHELYDAKLRIRVGIHESIDFTNVKRPCGTSRMSAVRRVPSTAYNNVEIRIAAESDKYLLPKKDTIRPFVCKAMNKVVTANLHLRSFPT
ncbi:hypothetical protein JB92DRAFT_728619 [Gautieria morchelliformis]|nr:hypothetical protein JB92DRAFT_728619 [Gautieria morchelliformis]